MSDENRQVSKAQRDEKQRLVQEMLRRRRSQGSHAASGIPPRDSAQPAKLSFAQQRLWFLEQLTPDSPAYVFANVVCLTGELDIAALEQSIAELTNRHENLRTGFQEIDGDLVQVVDNEYQFSLEVHDYTGKPEDQAHESLQNKARELSRQPFDLSSAPLFRAELVRMHQDVHTLILVTHHIIYDGWSLAVLFEELQHLYVARCDNVESTLPPLPVQYADFAIWQRIEFESEKWQSQFDYWTHQLKPPLPSLALPTDRKRPDVQDYEGGVEWFRFPAPLSAKLNALARREDCTLFMVLLAAFNVLLQRYTDQSEILVGTPIAGRNHRDIEPLIGFFVNTLVIRTHLDDDPAFCDLLQQVRRTTTDALANQDIPFESLVDALLPERRANENPIFQTAFALENTPPPPNNLGDLSMQIDEFDNGTAVFDLTLSMYENENGISGYFEYATALFDQTTIVTMCDAFQLLLEAFASDPEARISAPSLISAADRELVFGSFNDTCADYERGRTVVDLFQEACERQPNAVAIVDDGVSISYNELAQRSDNVMRHLLERGVRPNEFVGVCLNRSADMFAAILGTMKAGAAYLPLDPTYPATRLQFIVSDSQSRIILYSDSLDIDLPSLGSTAKLIRIEDAANAGSSDTPVAATVSPDSFAYAIYTSGSTGKPKAVPITHANLMHSNSARVDYYECDVSAFLLLSSFSFDSSIAGIFWTLCTGGTLVLPQEGQERDIFAIDKLIRENNVSHILCLPSVYSLLLDNMRDDSLSSLQVVCVAGEECPRALLDKHFESLPETALYNEYGPTEGTVWSTVHRCSVEDPPGTVSIGKPINNVEIYILDAHGNSQPVGVAGEICIAGHGLASGYLNRPELTEQKFLSQSLDDGLTRRVYRSGDLGRFRPDGNIEFLGRIDQQVKVNGYRIEIPEIENAILSVPAVSQVAVTVHRNASGDNRLVAFVVSELGRCDTIGMAIQDKLPAFMLPDLYVPISAMPLTPNGKVDKSALPDPMTITRDDDVALEWPVTDMQKALAAIWKPILEQEQIGLDQDFFSIGGNSILATRVISKVHHSFGFKLPVRYMFEYPTLRSLADKMLADTDNKERYEETAGMIVMIDEMSEEELDAMLMRQAERSMS